MTFPETQGKGRGQNVDGMSDITENSWGKTFAGTLSLLQMSCSPDCINHLNI